MSNNEENDIGPKSVRVNYFSWVDLKKETFLCWVQVVLWNLAFSPWNDAWKWNRITPELLELASLQQTEDNNDIHIKLFELEFCCHIFLCCDYDITKPKNFETRPTFSVQGFVICDVVCRPRCYIWFSRVTCYNAASFVKPLTWQSLLSISSVQCLLAIRFYSLAFLMQFEFLLVSVLYLLPWLLLILHCMICTKYITFDDFCQILITLKENYLLRGRNAYY